MAITKVEVIAAQGATLSGPMRIRITRKQHEPRQAALGPWKDGGVFDLDGDRRLTFKKGEVLGVELPKDRLNPELFSWDEPKSQAKRQGKKADAKPKASKASGKTQDPGTTGGTQDQGANGGTHDPAANGGTQDPGANGGAQDPGANGGAQDPGANGGTQDQGANGTNKKEGGDE